jgi:multiple sugar transport system substrate-binding protein
MFRTDRRNFLIGVSAAALLASMSGVNLAFGGDAANLTLMLWDPAQKAGVQKAVDAFEAANPDIHVSVEQVPEDQYYTKLDASLGAGQGPDVMWQSSKAFYYVDGGALQSLSEYIKQDKVSLTDYSKVITSLYEFKGEQYGLPKDQDAWTFVYNADVFKKLGVEVPASDWTWEDMVRIAQEIKAKQTSSSEVPMYYNYTFNNGVASLIHALGSNVIEGGKASVSSPAGTKALDMIKDLQDRGLILKVADAADFNPVSALISGHVAMAEIPSWNLSLLSKADVPSGTFNVVRMPSINGSWTTDTNGLAYVMNANSPHKDAAWKLIKFLTSEEGAVQHAEGGAGLPANTSKAALAAFVKANEKLVGLEDALSATRDQSYLRTSTQYPKTRASMSKINSSVMGPFYAGSISVSDAAKTIDEVLDGALR